MTGFGRAEGEIAGHSFSVEIKSVNHRYLDLRFRLPPSLAPYELIFADCLRSRFERGSFEINIRQKMAASSLSAQGGTRYVVDEVAARSLMDGLDFLHRHYKTPRIPTAEMFALAGRVLIPQEETPDLSTQLDALKALLGVALDDLSKMRKTEGDRLQKILADGLSELSRIRTQLTEYAPQHPQKIREKLQARIEQLGMTNVDAQRLEWEVAFYADRSDITEELDRLQAHIQEFEVLTRSPKSVGRKLDFLTQELHREINTVASKASMLEVTKAAVEGKTTIERLREQVQNVE